MPDSQKFLSANFYFIRKPLSSADVLTTLRKAEYFELITLFFIQAAAMGMWFVPLGTVLDAHGMHALKPFAFATTALAAFVSPLIFGAVADRHASPVKVLRWLALATALAMCLASTAINLGWSTWIVFAFIQLHALCSAPTWSITNTIVFARLADAKKEFAPIRAMATLGWAGGCLLISIIGVDRSPMAGFSAAAVWIMVAIFTFWLPAMTVPKYTEKLTWHERLGLDALTLLKNPGHRVVFIASALYSIPLSAFYPYATAHLQELGLTRTSAWMTLGQVTELIAMFSLGAILMRWPLKNVLGLGLAFGVVRFGLSALDGEGWLLTGVFLHGFSFVFFFITAQIYLGQRIEAAWRARAQALFSLMNSGFGNLIGYLGAGAWAASCASNGHPHWPMFWGGLCVVVMAVSVYFLIASRGVKLQEPLPSRNRP